MDKEIINLLNKSDSAFAANSDSVNYYKLKVCLAKLVRIYLDEIILEVEDYQMNFDYLGNIIFSQECYLLGDTVKFIVFPKNNLYFTPWFKIDSSNISVKLNDAKQLSIPIKVNYVKMASIVQFVPPKPGKYLISGKINYGIDKSFEFSNDIGRKIDLKNEKYNYILDTSAVVYPSHLKVPRTKITFPVTVVNKNKKINFLDFQL